MAILSGKTIGQLTLLSGITSDTLFPVEYSGFTFHIPYSGLTIGGGGTYEEVTYDELYSLYTGGTLTPGGYYLITDFQTIYDQPDFNENGAEIIGTTKTGNTEPLVVFATSGNTLSPTAFSPEYPQDKISYDITFYQTERTNTPAKGRITERIDERGNRADYDFRNVLFKRYTMYFSDVYYDGTLSMTSNGDVTGNGTNFSSDFNVGDILGVYTGIANNSPIGPFRYFEITSISGATQMTITGETMYSDSNKVYSRGEQYFRHINPFQSNIIGDTGFTEYYTFDEGADPYNVYIGNYANLFSFNENSFILSNNVFLGSDYESMTLGDNSFNNSFDDDMDSNVMGYEFNNNIITNDFDRNNIGNYFRGNIIMCDMRDNQIGNYFQWNMLGDNDGYDFDNNKISTYFEGNFTTFYNDGFENNTIGEYFGENFIDGGVYNNELIGDFYNNKIYAQFSENIVGRSFYGNDIDVEFRNNTIGSYFNSNEFSGGSFTNNYIAQEFRQNSVFDSDMRYNTIGNNFKGNFVRDNFEGNTIGYDFKGNQFFGIFSQNEFGNACTANNFSGETLNNFVGHGFIVNNIHGTFQNNKIGSSFSSNEIEDGFGFGGGQFQGNTIGNNFYDNDIGEYFYNNIIPDNFYNNTIGNYFQWNTVQTYVNGIDFGYYYGNITAFTYASIATGATDNVYIAVGGQTNGDGQNATFDIEVSGNAVVGVTGNSQGRYYNINDTITLLGTDIGGYSRLINTFSSNGIGKSGITGVYSSLLATGGTGNNATFDVTVTSNLVSDVQLNFGGSGYFCGDTITIIGSLFGGTDGDDDITITVDSVLNDDVIITVTGVSITPSVYEGYSCQIFNNSGYNLRLSYYDNSDILTITDINV